MVLDKPPGMVVNNAESVKGETVQDWVTTQLSATSVQLSDDQSDFYKRAGIVHRIDKETSGILLVANNPSSFAELQRQFKERLVKKTYLALLHGTIAKEGEINAPIGRLPWNREHFGIVPGGKESITRFTRVGNYEINVLNKPEQISLVEVYPETGRTHQIRVHFKYIGHPLLGDYLYAGRVQSRDDRKEIPRVMLHAWKIAFSHPGTGKPLAYEAPIPDDMNAIIKSQISS
jgi:23S rRNA pseudouridine1911/1915/1917 synthase